MLIHTEGDIHSSADTDLIIFYLLSADIVLLMIKVTQVLILLSTVSQTEKVGMEDRWQE